MGNLAGKRILITRPAGQSQAAADLVMKAGGIPICFPVIEISPPESYDALDAAIQKINTFNWLILTSVHGVEAVWDRILKLGITISRSLQIACVGPKTAEALEAKGLRCAFIPNKYTGHEIMPGLGQIEGKRFLLARANLARQTLPELIKQAGGEVFDLAAYRTTPSKPDLAILNEIQQGLDVITFTSPSTVFNLIHILKTNGLELKNLPGNPIIACIGPITAQEAKEHGLQVHVIPEAYTVAGQYDALQIYFKTERVNP